MKVNTDAAYDQANRNGATACVLRDESGGVREAQAKWYEHVFDVCTMEAMACRDGIQVAADAGYQCLHVETDCLEFVQLWRRKESQLSIAGSVIAEIVNLSNGFQDFSISYVSRNCNKIAHVLAKQVTSTHSLERWHVTPACVSNLVLIEASAN